MCGNNAHCLHVCTAVVPGIEKSTNTLDPRQLFFCRKLECMRKRDLERGAAQAVQPVYTSRGCFKGSHVSFKGELVSSHEKRKSHCTFIVPAAAAAAGTHADLVFVTQNSQTTSHLSPEGQVQKALGTCLRRINDHDVLFLWRILQHVQQFVRFDPWVNWFLFVPQVYFSLVLVWFGLQRPPVWHGCSTYRYHNLAPQPCSTTLYHNLEPQPCTTTLHHNLAPQPCTTTLHHNLVPQPCTTTLHHNLVPQPCTTTLYHNLAPQPCTTTLHHTLVPQERMLQKIVWQYDEEKPPDRHGHAHTACVYGWLKTYTNYGKCTAFSAG